MALEVVKDGLWLRGTYPLENGSKARKRLSLKLPASDANLIKAEERALELHRLIAEQGYLPAELPWEIAETTKSSAFAPLAARPVAAWVGGFEENFWRGRVRTGAAENTWERICGELNRLPQGAEMTVDLLIAVALETAAGSRSRLEACKVYKRLAKFAGLEDLVRFDEIRTPYEPAERELPQDEEIIELVERLRSHPTYGWMTAALATYGCRPAEITSLRPVADGTAEVLTVKRQGKTPTRRTAIALSPRWPERFDLFSVSRPWDIWKPTEYDSLQARRLTQSWQAWLKRHAPGWQLYNLRHAWAVRSIKAELNASLAAKAMGHSLQVHSNTYHRWMVQGDVAAAAARLAERFKD